MTTKQLRVFIFIFISMMTSQSFAAEYPLQLKNDFINFIDNQGGLEQAQQSALHNTAELRTQCFNCHGEKGISPDYTSNSNKITANSKIYVGQQFNTPNLAAQQALYLIQQLTEFMSNKRKNSVMHKISIKLSQEEIFLLALYFSVQPAKVNAEPKQGSLDKIAAGKKIYLDRCQFCHGGDAAGQGIYARLAGLNYYYLFDNIQQFRDKKTQRKHAGMTAITKGLSNSDITQLALFLSTHN